MNVSRFVFTALLTVGLWGLSARPASASSFQLCLMLDEPVGHQYFLNFAVQGNAVLVSGMKGYGGQDDHGPIQGSMSRTPLPSYGF